MKAKILTKFQICISVPLGKPTSTKNLRADFSKFSAHHFSKRKSVATSFNSCYTLHEASLYENINNSF